MCFREPTFNQTQSYDEYYDASSYMYQDERYGQDEEDRQWDSGGFYSAENKANTVNTANVYQENHINKRRNSVLPQTPTVKNDYYPGPRNKRSGYDDEPYATPPTPSTRRRIPQIPKRASSRQGSLNDYEAGYYDECRTPENSSHRGASLPPTPTTTPKLLARIAAHTKPSVSLPPTPGRQLPKPNLNHRSAKARRNNLMKRTSSAEYNDPEQLDDPYSYYMRPGAVSAREMYNEDYNYAYQSTDNLPAQPGAPAGDDSGDTLTPVAQQPSIAFPTTYPGMHTASVSEQRTSAGTNSVTNASAKVAQNGTIPSVVTSVSYQGQSADEYYYSAQEDRDYRDPETDYYEPKSLASTRKKKLGRRENSPLLQQNTDSLESRDDELKDSFETAVSSISSTLPQQRRGPYSTAGETGFLTNTTCAMAPSMCDMSLKPTTTATTTVTAMQYPRDQETPKAIVSVNGTSVRDNVDNYHNTTSTTVASNNNTNTTMMNNHSPALSTRNTSRMLKQQDSVDRGYFNHQESLDQSDYMDQQEPMNQNYVKTDATDNHYFTQQESIESYTEEMTLTNGMVEEYNGKAGKESPVSVIHVETFEPTSNGEEDNLLRGSNHLQNNLMDPYHPNLQRPDPYAPVRRPSIDPYRPLSPSRLTSGDGYPIPGSRKGSIVDQYGNTAPRKNSTLDPYPVPLSRRTSIRHSPNQEILKQDSMDQVTPPESIGEHDPEKKSVSFEEEEEVKPVRREITAKQRWHWAYNKIIMQLNVSTILNYVLFIYEVDCKGMRVTF